jgi:hypothetical protein
MRNLAARVERLERKLPPILRTNSASADPMMQWVCERYPDLMSRYAELVKSFGPDEAIRRLSDDDLEQLDCALRAAADA